MLHPSSFILHPSSFILHPSSFILHPSSFILHPSSFILHPSSFILHPSYPSSFILHSSSFIFTLHPADFVQSKAFYRSQTFLMKILNKNLHCCKAQLGEAFYILRLNSIKIRTGGTLYTLYIFYFKY